MNISHKSIFVFIFAALFCQQGFAQVNLDITKTRIPANDQEIKELAHTFLTHLVQGNMDHAGDLLSNEFQNFGSEKPMNKANFLKMWKTYHDEATDLAIKEGGLMAFEIVDGSEKGTYAGVYGLMTWTPKQTQKPVNIWGHMMIKVENGKISQIYDFQDNLSSMMQMGFTLTPPSAGK